MFFDHAKIHVAAGNGGNGCVSFRREMHVPRGGPDGGDGGRGGDVIVVGDPQLRDLQPFTYKVHFKAGPATPGQGARKHGANGEDVDHPGAARHPVWRAAEAEDGRADRRRHPAGPAGARGAGRRPGGRGNARFVNSVRQAPQFAELGEEGGELLAAALSASSWPTPAWPACPTRASPRCCGGSPTPSPRWPTTRSPPSSPCWEWSTGRARATSSPWPTCPGCWKGRARAWGWATSSWPIWNAASCCCTWSTSPATTGSSRWRASAPSWESWTPMPSDLASKPQMIVLNKIDAVPPEAVEEHGRRCSSPRWSGSAGQGHPAFTYVDRRRAAAGRRLVWPVSAVTGAGLQRAAALGGTAARAS